MVRYGAIFAMAILACSCSRQMKEDDNMAVAAGTITVHTTAFQNGGAIPSKYTPEGASPPLAWDSVPAGAKELVLIVDDPDAPTKEPFVHWVVYGIPPSVTVLSEGAGKEGGPLPKPAKQGSNTTGRIGYMGPQPPPGHGVHHYHFKLYALDKPLNLEKGLTKEQVLKSFRSNGANILAEGELIGTYERK